MVISGGTIRSLDVIDNVIVSPALARLVSSTLLETMLTAKNRGTVRSIVTTLESVTSVTVTPSLLAKSSNTMDIDASASATSCATTVYVAVQDTPLPSTPAGRPASTTDGSTMGSLVAIVNSMVSPSFARPLSFALSQVTLTIVTYGMI